MGYDAFYNMIGIGAKAGKYVYGTYAVKTHIRNGKIDLALIDGSASGNLKKTIQDSCTYYETACIVLRENDVLSKRVGRDIKVLGVRDKQFSAVLKNKYREVSDRISGGEANI